MNGHLSFGVHIYIFFFRKTSAASQAGASTAQGLQGGLGVQAWEDNCYHQDDPTV